MLLALALILGMQARGHDTRRLAGSRHGRAG